MVASSWYVIVVGCGRLGAYVANQLSLQGHDVVVVDINKEAFGHLSHGFSGFLVEGDATELSVLKQAKIEQANLVIASTRRDNVNLMVAQVAKTILGVPRVIARVFNPEREETYQKLGVETVCSTIVAGNSFLFLI
ncbi:MAG TPA: TrkA family potassium uptake protein [Candidatus Hydrogenedentes bacterium]|nr:TrkA family potassium uptake protein [Candidatus Hydrogenedentota bacterium]HPG69860.1 TrkA family potassium uptake protein [Candidatus Hydrogenedentota bacterium]